jgi:hypothetical protein
MEGEREGRGVDVLVGLLGKDPSEILCKIAEGDPLGLQPVCMRLIRSEALIMDPARLLEAALLEVAANAGLCEVEDLHPDWLDHCVERALKRLCNQDREAVRKGKAPPIEDGGYDFVSDAFGVKYGDGRKASVAFQDLELRARRAFFALLVDEKSIEEVIEMGLGTEETLREDVWNALRALGHVTADEVQKFLEKTRS